jgi:hypothetical protein
MYPRHTQQTIKLWLHGFKKLNNPQGEIYLAGYFCEGAMFFKTKKNETWLAVSAFCLC